MRGDSSNPYRLPLLLSVVYLGVIALVALVPAPSRDVARGEATPTPSERPAECFVCGIDKECDPDTGRCVFTSPTPLPCVEGTKFDERAGFCLPEAGAQPTIIPEGATPGPGGRAPRAPDLPGFGGGIRDND
jgi:hypothetical protein